MFLILKDVVLQLLILGSRNCSNSSKLDKIFMPEDGRTLVILCGKSN